jgi:hypothetical protein
VVNIDHWFSDITPEILSLQYIFISIIMIQLQIYMLCTLCMSWHATSLTVVPVHVSLIHVHLYSEKWLGWIKFLWVLLICKYFFYFTPTVIFGSNFAHIIFSVILPAKQDVTGKSRAMVYTQPVYLRNRTWPAVIQYNFQQLQQTTETIDKFNLHR